MDYVDKLSESLEEAVKRSCSGLKDVGLIFSAGIDSTLIGVLASKFAKVRAYNVGISCSHDSSHALESESRLPFAINHIEINEEAVEKELPKIVAAIGEPNPLKVSVAVPFHFASKKAAEDGINVMLCGQGPDELFGGYNRYLRTVSKRGYKELESELGKDAREAWDSQLRYDFAVAESNGVELRFPYLDEEFKAAALKVPAEEKIKKVTGESPYGCVDDVDGSRYVRKYALRKVAEKAGVPETIVNRPKKAAQYGSGSEKIIKEIARKRGFCGCDAIREYVESLMDS